MKIRTFRKRIAVTDQVIAQLKGELEDYIRGLLETDFDEQRGPRGGRYVAVGPITMRTFQTHDDWMRSTTSFVIERPMRYVRPTP